MTVAAIIVNYNMPERTNALAECILKNDRGDCSLIVVDNGSDIAKPSKYTNLWLPENRQTTGGWLAGLRLVKLDHPNYYWFLITSAEFVPDKEFPLYPMLEFMEENQNAVGIHPVLTKDSTSSWNHLFTKGGDKPRPTWMIDNIASLYRADWFNSIGWFDPALKYAWGIDLETGWKARSQNRSLWMDERVFIKKISNIGYTMKRMNMSAKDRETLAAKNTESVFTERYGKKWRSKLLTEYVTKEMVDGA